MGKTKTAVIGGTPAEEKSGKAAYEAKKRRQEAVKKAQEQKEKDAVKGVGLKGGERIKVIGSDAPLPEAAEDKEVEGKSTRKAKAKVRSKNYKSALGAIDKTKTYAIKDAVKLVQQTSYSKFDGTVELHLKVKKDGLAVNVELPYSSGKTKRIEVADDKTVDKLKKGKIDFDVLLATADMMPKLVPFAKLLGPKGLMPNPKAGTLIKDKKEADKFKGNSVQIKTEKKQPVIHAVVGKVSQKASELEANTSAVIEAVTAKQIDRAHICGTMSPSVKIKI